MLNCHKKILKTGDLMKRITFLLVSVSFLGTACGMEQHADIIQGAPNRIVEALGTGDVAGMTILMREASMGYLPDVNELIHAGANVNAKDSQGQTPLMYAVREYAGRYPANPAVVQALIKAGADVNAEDKTGRTALIHAVGSDVSVYINPKVIEALLQAGADPNKVDIKGRTALTQALFTLIHKPEYAISDANLREVIRLLIKASSVATINKIDWSFAGTGKTPLMLAAVEGDPLIVQLLLDRDADPKITVPGFEGTTLNALQAARVNNKEGAARILEQAMRRSAKK